MRLPIEPEDRPPEVNVVALIDVLFAILTFFIITSLTLSRTEGLSVNLPGASSGKIQDQTKIVITINDRGAMALNKRSTDLPNLVPQINSLMVKDRFRTANATRTTMVVINADQKVEHGRIVAVMDLVQQIPGVKLGIATKRK
jgi:biopolymer transport protein ExbD